jgi:hypothetical protein
MSSFRSPLSSPCSWSHFGSDTRYEDRTLDCKGAAGAHEGFDLLRCRFKCCRSPTVDGHGQPGSALRRGGSAAMFDVGMRDRMVGLSLELK